jgi:hypothetical protein
MKEKKIKKETLQQIKESAMPTIENDENVKSSLKLPKLEISNDDRDLYAECIATGKVFSQKFENEKLKIKVEFKDKTKKETDIISRQVDKIYNDGLLYSVQEYINLFNLGCLYYQLSHINGVKQNHEYPANVWDMKDFNLTSVIDASPIGSLPSSTLYILMGMMTQFNQKLYDLAKEAFNPNFLNPAKDS